MIVGVPREIKPQENRVALVPGAVRTLVDLGHDVMIQAGAGAGSGFSDTSYQEAGATCTERPQDVFAEGDLILKIKEPQESEVPMLRPGRILFTYLHLAPNPALTQGLMDSGCIAIAYESVQLPDGSLPLLAPMSQVAGRMSIQAGAHCLEIHQGGKGLLLGGIPGVRPARVVIVGGGNVGTQAAQMALGLGADVTLLDIRADVLAHLDLIWKGRLKTVMFSPHALAEEIAGADLVIGAVLAPGARAPHLITREMVRGMEPGSVIVDVAIDQGGCSETSRPTTHADPTYVDEGVVHYCVANIPGAVARTSTLGLTSATLPYVLQLAAQGAAALSNNPALAAGLNVSRGKLCNKAVAEGTGLPYTPPDE